MLKNYNLDLYKRRPHKDIRKYNFTYRVVGLWNSLPSHVVNGPTLNTFKNRLDRILADEEVLYKYRAMHHRHWKKNKLPK